MGAEVEVRALKAVIQVPVIFFPDLIPFLYHLHIFESIVREYVCVLFLNDLFVLFPFPQTLDVVPVHILVSDIVLSHHTLYRLLIFPQHYLCVIYSILIVLAFGFVIHLDFRVNAAGIRSVVSQVDRVQGRVLTVQESR